MSPIQQPDAVDAHEPIARRKTNGAQTRTALQLLDRQTVARALVDPLGHVDTQRAWLHGAADQLHTSPLAAARQLQVHLLPGKQLEFLEAV